MPDQPLAYFITFRTYGTWLAGDVRGSVDDDHNRFGEPFAGRDDFRNNYQKRLLKAAPFVIETSHRAAIESAIVELCGHRDWGLFALNVRTNHVHVVVAAGQSPEKVLADLKAYCTRGLRRTGTVAAGRPIWAAGGSTRRAWDEVQAERCVAYTLDAQGDDLPGSGWAAEKRRWIAGDSSPPGPDGTGY